MQAVKMFRGPSVLLGLPAEGKRSSIPVRGCRPRPSECICQQHELDRPDLQQLLFRLLEQEQATMGSPAGMAASTARLEPNVFHSQHDLGPQLLYTASSACARPAQESCYVRDCGFGCKRR